jgi:hypothetical protein
VDAPALSPMSAALPRRSAFRFIVLLGIVSLFADMTYESARSITGPYLALLGASATVVGLVSGFGEPAGGLRAAADLRIPHRPHRTILARQSSATCSTFSPCRRRR